MAEKKGFDLAAVLGGVSNLDTGAADGRDKIEYIDIDHIDDDPRNFYELTNLDELAANIELFGLQQPIRVRDGEDGHVIIISGHRRRAAIRKLVESGRDDLKQIPCIREHSAGSDALQELRLIYANSDTRKLSSAEISKQAERVEALLYQLKEEGYDFPGRMRDHVAEACKVSKTKLARLKMIRDKLNPCWKPSYEGGELGESTAYALAQIPAEHQRAIFNSWKERDKTPRQLYENMVKTFGERLAGIDKVECKQCGGNCSNFIGKRHKALNADSWSYVPCGSICCGKCESLAHCKDACHLLSDQIKRLKADASAQRKQEKLAQEEMDRPIISEIKALWNRFGQARAAAGKSLDDCCKALNVSVWALGSDDEVMAKECLEAKFNTSTKLPYGYSCCLDEVKRFVRIADMLGCSVDYLFCRTDNPKGMEATAITAHQTEAPVQTGPAWHPATVEPDIGQGIIVVDENGYAEDATYLGNGKLDGEMRWDEVVLWSPAPTEVTMKNKHDAPAEGWVPLQYLPGQERPTKVGQQAVALFSIDGREKPMRSIAAWNGSRWCFPGHGATIDAECVGWFPLPKDEGGSDNGTS